MYWPTPLNMKKLVNFLEEQPASDFLKTIGFPDIDEGDRKIFWVEMRQDPQSLRMIKLRKVWNALIKLFCITNREKLLMFFFFQVNRLQLTTTC